jgi:hypothetical protein
MVETPRRRISVTSSLNEISTDPLGNRVNCKRRLPVFPAGDGKIANLFLQCIINHIYLSRVLCLSVCVSQFVAERSAILLVLIIKLTKETRRRVWRGRDRGGETGKRQIVEGGCEETFLSLSLN